MPVSPDTVFSVSDLNRLSKQTLDHNLPLLWLEGEISNFSRPGSGHWYFTLKDDQAQIRCALFRNRNQRLGFVPEHGQQVLMRGRVGLYEPRGDYQFIGEHMEASGHGELQRRFEALKQKLDQEGLFDPDIKQELPAYPQCLGVITSPTGAALRDVLSVLKRRYPMLRIKVFGSMVQGDGAAQTIVTAIQQADADNDCDVLLVTRGGGSLEDLWSFNEESLARAIHAAKKPVVSAVGHEIDTTIADFVADLRAPTPSAAAELITPDQQELQDALTSYQFLLRDLLLRRVEQRSQHSQHLLTRLNNQHPEQQLQRLNQRVDEWELRLQRLQQRRLESLSVKLSHLMQRLQQVSPARRIAQQEEQLKRLTTRLIHSGKRNQQRHQEHFAALTQALQAYSPLNVLKRGYAIAQTQDGTVLRSAEDASKGDQLNLRLGKGEIDVTVN